MRVFTLIIISILFLSELVEYFAIADKSPRTKKASKATLDRIKRLINAQAERYDFYEVSYSFSEVAQNDAVALDEELPLRNPQARQHHDELSVNDPEQYFQGDVELSEHQAEGLQDELMEVLNDPMTQVDEPMRKKRKIGKVQHDSYPCHF